MTSLFRSRFMASTPGAAALLCIVLSAPAASIAQQPEQLSQLSVQQRIQHRLIVIQNHPNAPSRQLGSQWAILAADYADAAQFNDAENAFNHAIQILSRDPADAALYAMALDQLGALYRIYDRLPESLNCSRKAFEVRRQHGEPLSSALSQSHMAEILLVQHKYKEAFNSADQAYRVMEQDSATDKTDLLSAVIVKSYAQCGMHKRAACLADAEEALAISRNAFPADSHPVGAALIVLGSAQVANKAYSQAQENFARGLEIFKSHLSTNDPRVVYAMERYRDCLHSMHQEEEARDLSQQLMILSHQPPGPCPGCTVSGYALRTSNKQP